MKRVLKWGFACGKPSVGGALHSVFLECYALVSMFTWCCCLVFLIQRSQLGSDALQFKLLVLHGETLQTGNGEACKKRRPWRPNRESLGQNP